MKGMQILTGNDLYKEGESEAKKVFSNFYI